MADLIQENGGSAIHFRLRYRRPPARLAACCEGSSGEMREPDGRFKKGASGNPGGRRPEGASFEAAARRILEGRIQAEALETVPPAARALLPRRPRYHDALAAVLVASSLAGDTTALRELLKRLWPAPRPVELSAAPIRVELEPLHEHTLASDPEALAEVLGILNGLRVNGQAVESGSHTPT